MLVVNTLDLWFLILYEVTDTSHSGHWNCCHTTLRKSNSMSNYPGHDTLTIQILFIFSIFLDSVEMIDPWKFKPSTPYGSEAIEICKFDQNGCFSNIWHFEYLFSVITIVLVILSSWNLVWVSFLGVRNPKINQP